MFTEFVFLELFIKILSVFGALYLMMQMFQSYLYPDLIAAYKSEASDQVALQKDIAQAEFGCKDNEKTIENTHLKIATLEDKTTQWIANNQQDVEARTKQSWARAQKSLERTNLIDRNSQAFVQQQAVVGLIKDKICADLNARIFKQVQTSPQGSSPTDFEDFTTATTVIGRRSFAYAKVFFQYLTKHNFQAPDPEFLISLSHMFKSYGFFFFVKGALINQDCPEEGMTERICLLTCKKGFTQGSEDQRDAQEACLSCYSWREVLTQVKINPQLQRFLEIIIGRNAQKIIPDVLKELAFLIYASNNQLLCEVESAVELNQEEVKSICDKIALVYKQTPVCVFQINPCLLGGVLIRSNRFRIDNSTYAYLNKVFYKLDSA